MVVDPHEHIWGTRGRSDNLPRLDDLCYLCEKHYADLPPGKHFIDPSRAPLRWAVV